ncbi:MAG: WYL domain-containing protein [Lachnospiraceae bacterium]|nr:WYL domain-containing protein [Lachnospiraceae bacterium]GFH92938.1 hypothetical protein IMSAGC002_04211 [Lachnospiraceae bacterium]
MQKGNTLSLHQFKNSDCLLAGGLKILEEGDGIIDMGINSSALEWVADFILPLGKNATVLEPVELLDIMKRKIHELYQHYFNVEDSKERQ